MDEISTTKKAWDAAAKEYKAIVERQLSSSDKDVWMRMVYEHAPKKEKLRVLDIGTGPGFFTIALSLDGHDVTGVDLSEGMLEVARKNAEEFGAKCDFRQMNADRLYFESDTFDLIINRNVTWTIPDMEECYREWRRVLAPDGKLLVFDSNFNWNFFDPEHDKLFRKLIRDMRILGQDSGTVNSGFMFRGSYMETRPMIGLKRPQWDRNMLIKLRFMDIVAEEDVLVGGPLDRMPDPEAPAPLFLISARKPSPEEEKRFLVDEYWDGVAPFDSGTCHRVCADGRGKEYFDSLKGRVPPKARILDLACGSGFLSIAASFSGHEVVEVDSSKYMIEEAERCSSEFSSSARFVMADACDLPFDDGTFGAVIIRNSLWSFFEPEKALEEACRVLAKDGILMIIDADWINSLDPRRPRKNDDGVRIRGGESGFGGTEVIDPIFRRLPLTGVSRPSWDIHQLEKFGMKILDNDQLSDSMVEAGIRGIVGDSFIVVAKRS
ncbi:MAG: class I SAM-dependent methyltransferase [Thermoplasmata archaeon]|nr:class I SAM-dependent methyltransferase [Thermoplasmata archaeon]